MKKNLLYIKKNINYLLKKKKIKDFCLINEKEIFKNLRFLKIFFFLNIYARFFFQYIESDIDFGSFFLYYNVIKNIWYFFLNKYHIICRKIKIKIKTFFNIFYTKNILKNVFILDNLILKRKKNISFIFKYNINEILKRTDKKIIYRLLRKRKKIFNINLFLKKKHKNLMKNIIKVKFFLYFFNKYKFFLFIKSLKYYIKTFNFKFRRQFLLYWIRFYKYSLTRFLVNIEYCLVKYFNYIKKQYNSFNSLINIKKTKENIYIFFCFFYNQYKDVFLTNYKIAPLISASKLLKFNYIEKNNFSLFFFKIIKKNIILIYLKNLKKLKILFKIKFLIFLKNYIFLILLQYLISWFNYYILTLKGFNIYRSMIVDYFKCKYTKTENLFFGLNIINSYKWNSLSFLSFNYFFFNNMVIKKKWWNW